MNSTFVLTLKCLVLSALIAVGCTIAETIDFNFDFSGTRTIEFQYREAPEDGSTSNEDNEGLHGLKYIDSISYWVDNVSNIKIDTSDYEMAKVSYDFTADGPQIKDLEKYNYFLEKMPEEYQWYFKERPNSFKKINKNKVLWKAVNKNLESLDFGEMEKLTKNLKGATSITTLNFARKIKAINPQSLDIIISSNGKSIISEVNFDEVTSLKRANEVVITFE